MRSKESIGLGKCTGWPFCDLDPRSRLWHWCKQKFACLQDKVRTTQPITTKLGSYIPLVMFITWLEEFFGKLFLPNFLWKLFSQGQTLYWTYLRNGWSHWCEIITMAGLWGVIQVCSTPLCMVQCTHLITTGGAPHLYDRVSGVQVNSLHSEANNI